jgi:hypothetical protein
VGGSSTSRTKDRLDQARREPPLKQKARRAKTGRTKYDEEAVLEQRDGRTIRLVDNEAKLEGATQMEHNAPANAKVTRLGEQGAAYGSEAMEDLVAERMARLSATGRSAGRMEAIRQLANEGRIATYHSDQDGFERELRDSLTPEARARVEHLEAAHAAAAGSRTLAEAAARQAQRSTSAGSTVVKLSEEDRREARIAAFTKQGYSRQHAEHVADFEANRARKLAAQRLPGQR